MCLSIDEGVACTMLATCKCTQGIHSGKKQYSRETWRIDCLMACVQHVQRRGSEIVPTALYDKNSRREERAVREWHVGLSDPSTDAICVKYGAARG